MHVTRIQQAQAYEAPLHFDVRSLRLQGFQPEGPKNSWVGLSYFLPQGGAGPDASPLEKIYVVLQGELQVRSGDQEVTLGPLDSCTIPPGEVREVRNRTNQVVTLLVVMPYPAPKP